MNYIIKFFWIIDSFDVDSCYVPGVCVHDCIGVGVVSVFCSINVWSRFVTFCMLFSSVDILISVAIVMKLSLIGV